MVMMMMMMKKKSPHDKHHCTVNVKNLMEKTSHAEHARRPNGKQPFRAEHIQPAAQEPPSQNPQNHLFQNYFVGYCVYLWLQRMVRPK